MGMSRISELKISKAPQDLSGAMPSGSSVRAETCLTTNSFQGIARIA
jgi:hypothetical protein